MGEIALTLKLFYPISLSVKKFLKIHIFNNITFLKNTGCYIYRRRSGVSPRRPRLHRRRLHPCLTPRRRPTSPPSRAPCAASACCCSVLDWQAGKDFLANVGEPNRAYTAAKSVGIHLKFACDEWLACPVGELFSLHLMPCLGNLC